MELFVKDVESALDNGKLLSSLSEAPLFMLPKQMSDRLALEALFKSTGGAGWHCMDDVAGTAWTSTSSCGWMTDADLEDWEGVRVNEHSERVTQLILKGNMMAGPLPSEIQQLSALQVFDLSNDSYQHANALTGRVPAELGQLGALTILSLGNNQLTGSIPAELGLLGALESLGLDSNHLTGSIPKELGQLHSLETFSFESNQLTGRIPVELCQLPAVSEFILTKNQLTGPIPSELGQMATLQVLCLDENHRLSGQEALQSYMEEHNPGCELNLGGRRRIVKVQRKATGQVDVKGRHI
jgi:Leucine-rich repeat (LRR) protein